MVVSNLPICCPRPGACSSSDLVLPCNPQHWNIDFSVLLYPFDTIYFSLYASQSNHSLPPLLLSASRSRSRYTTAETLWVNDQVSLQALLLPAFPKCSRKWTSTWPPFELNLLLQRSLLLSLITQRERRAQCVTIALRRVRQGEGNRSCC